MLALPPAVPCVEMVLPVRIELTTSALPRMRSTTELRQHVWEDGRAYGLARARLSTDRCRMARIDKDREQRLAAALRENLRKRKAQARETTAPEPDAARPDEPVS